jgi:3-hydroxybutyryl-CoA dehydrogenase
VTVEVKKIGVLGAGTMGAGIAQVLAEAGYTVVLVDVEEEFVTRGINSILKNWDKAVAKGKMTAEEAEQKRALLSTAVGNNAFADVDIVIEAIIENIAIKKKVMQELDALCQPDAILATNTSALSITEIAAATGRPGQVVGMHFFNPVPAMQLVEIIPGVETSPDIIATVVELSRKINKDPVAIKESPGFIVNRILIPYINEAAILYQEGAASAAEIDKAMKLGANMPMGPLALADLIGIDVCLMIMEYFLNEFGDSKYRPALSLKQKLRAGHLGRKSGKGFFEYNG